MRNSDNSLLQHFLSSYSCLITSENTDENEIKLKENGSINCSLIQN